MQTIQIKISSSLQKILLESELLLISFESLAILKLGLDLLNELLLLLLTELLLLSLQLSNVTSSIHDLRNLFLLLDLLVLLKHPVGISLSLKVTGVHNPRLRAQLRAEFVVMCDHDNSSIVTLNSTSKGSQRFTVKVVSRLVQNENVRLVPHSSCKHDFHLLSSRKGRHTVVSSEFSSKTTSSQVLLDILGGKRADVKTGALGDLHIDSLHSLVPTHLLQNLGTEVLSAVHGRSSVLDLILKVLALVRLPSTHKLGNDLLHLGNLSSLFISERDLIRGLLELQLVRSELQSDLDKRLLILTLVGVTPTDVLIGSLVQVLLNMVESVLSDVSDTGIGVLPHISNLRLDLSDQKLDHGRLSGTILANAGNTRTQTDLNGDIE
mmetsp:Transcript_8622/g.12728  ORF Transcript_8622/g.12728 Transcript_8622/m.12728 type:complete len:380 (-) Transcript_8622:2091-3230(-)